ncbi:CIC11C00000001140 [Sungouiella intermedia]|uniref:CIC11C00000001140 n=1 Tax=Sungouiella intermedia TaxID=45354 RepID=A0A1L0CSU8_9ASCO|nr:CIC11C00000001140 [[Candida] intermedia]
MSKTIELDDLHVRTQPMPELSMRSGPSEIPEPNLNPVTSFSPVESPVDTQQQDNTEDSPDQFPDGGWKAISVVIGSHIGLIVNFGILNAVGAVQAYVSSHQLAGEKVSTVSWVFSIYMCLPFFLGAFVGPIFDSKGGTVLLILSTVLLFGGFIAVSFSKSIVAFIFSLSLCMGTAHALAITPLISLVSHWFLLNRGKAIGMASLGGSVGGTIWPLILQRLYSTVGFGWGIRIVGFICLAGLVASVVLVKSRFRRSIGPEDSEHLAKSKKLMQQTKYFFDLTAFKDPRFSFLVLGVFFTEISLMSILTYLATYAIAHGFSEKDSLTLLTVLNATGILGRYIPGHFADIYGTFNVMVLMLTGFSISVFACWLPFGNKVAGLYVFSVLCGFFSSSILSLTPLCLGSITPVDQFGQRYGLMYTFSSVGILFGLPVGAAIIGEGSVSDYSKFALFCGVFSLVGTLCWAISRYQIVGLLFNSRV